MKQYSGSIYDIINKLQTNISLGLSDDQVKDRLSRYGLNVQNKEVTISLFYIFLRQFIDPMIYLLLGSGIVLVLLGNITDALIMTGILLLNTIIGMVQEGRIALILDNINGENKRYSLVIRNGKKELICDTQLVPGDILVLQNGNQISADVRIIKSYDFRVNESMITGESESVFKNADDIAEDSLLYQLSNIAFAGSCVVAGHAHAIVIATGNSTYLGTIKKSIESVSPDMPLQKDLDRLLQFTLWSIMAIIVALLCIGLFEQRPYGELIAILVALFVCVVPQGFMVIMRLILVSGAYRLVNNHIFVKKLQAVEALGRVKVMIFDKTGTVTKNELIVIKIIAGNKEYNISGNGYDTQGSILYGDDVITLNNCDLELNLMLIASVLLDRSKILFNVKTQSYIVKGSPTQAALRVCSEKLYGQLLDTIFDDYKEQHEIPFSSQNAFHVGVYQNNNNYVVFGIGAPEVIMAKSLSVSDYHKKMIDEYVNKGYRVLALGYKKFSSTDLLVSSLDSLFDRDVEFIGIYIMHDQLRADFVDTVLELKNAGVHLVMATGDHLDTALHIARKSHILMDNDNGFLDGVELSHLSDEMLDNKIMNISVFARVLPDDKVRIVKSFQRVGNITAMVGDGVNDAQAIKVADLGISLGNTGAALAQQAAEVIILNDQFNAMIIGIKQGRHMLYSFKRVITYFFAANFSEVMVMLFGFAWFHQLPLLASHILWFNFMSDGLIDTALAMEPQEDGLFSKKWFNDAQLINSRLIHHILILSSITTIISLFIFNWYKSDLVLARTMLLATLTICHWFSALNYRSFKNPLWKLSFFSNKWLLYALIIIFICFVTIIHVPFFQHIFNVVPLSLYQWLLLVSIGAFVFICDEISKLFD